MKTFISAIYNLFATMNPTVRAILGLGAVALAINRYVNAMWGELFSRVDSIAAGQFGSADFSPVGFINYVFPLDTMLTFITAYGALRLVCATIRIIKSFIPTIS